ncbi:MAG: gliding motility-associated C-terminal domain-containing protein [Bacteroidota bacterium]
MDFKKIFSYIIFFFLFLSATFAGEKFWIGGSGNWNDPSHWSEKSGGKNNSSVPSSLDDVIFDNNSFRNDGDVVFINSNAECRNMTWQNLSYTPVFSGTKTISLYVYGSLAFAPEMTNQFEGKLFFKSNQNGNTIFSANQIFSGDIYFDGKEGEWKLLNDIQTSGTSSIYLLEGSLNTNSKNIFCQSFICSGEKKRSLVLGNSKVIIRDQWDFNNTFNLIFDAGQSKIIFLNKTSSRFLDCTVSGFTTKNPTCNKNCDGAIKVLLTGGTPPFTYQWLPTTPYGAGTDSIYNLCNGTYLIIVTDGDGNVCAGDTGIYEPAALFGITSQKSATCMGNCDGKAIISSVTGGTPPYTYAWSSVPVQTTSTATGLCTGNYTITLTDRKGCIFLNNVTVNQPLVLSPNGSLTNITCFGNCNGTASVAPTGGTLPYTYLWMPGGATTSSILGLCAPSTYTCTVTDANRCVTTYIASIAQATELTVAVTGTNLLCNGVCTGSARAIPSGGNSPYTYLWVPGNATTSSVTGLCAGTYSITVTDANGCNKNTFITITQPPVLDGTITKNNITCNGLCNGQATANPIGGTSPYTYLWSTGQTTQTITGLCVGTYSITGTDANGCIKTGNVAITEPALLTVTPSKTDVTCNGICNGSVTATVAGGTIPYTYAWSNGCTTSACLSLCAGTYSITVTDFNGCTATASITINSPILLVPNLSSVPASCFGVCDGSVSSSPSGGTLPYTYLWSSGCTTSSCIALCAGSYTLILTDANSCVVTKTVSITQPIVLTTSVIAVPNPLSCFGDCNETAAVSVSGGSAPYTYLWSPGGQTTHSITGQCSGTFTVNVTDAKGCTSFSTVTVTEPNLLTVVTIPVNPSCNGMCDGSISATVSGGVPSYTYQWMPGGQTTSSITGLCSGSYTLTVTDSKGCNNMATFTLITPPILNANASIINNISCAGICDGSVTANPTGGTLPYTYLWNPGSITSQTVTGLCAGTYIVTVRDANNCTDIETIIITQPNVLSASIASTTSSCTSCTGSATVSPLGGTLPYTFSWAPSGQTTITASGLCIGTYTVIVTDANNCATTVTAIINPVVTLTITVSGTIMRCNGSCDGIATVTPFGGFTPYTYTWTPSGQTTQSATGLCAGTHTIVVADVNGCFTSGVVTFTDPQALGATLNSTTASCGLCNGTATATSSGGTGAYTYLWSSFPIQTSSTATGLCPGSYTVTINDANNCIFTNTVSVGNIPVITDNHSVTNANCGMSNGSICVAPTGGTFPYTYLWSPGGATTSCITGIPAGIYTITITDVLACSNVFPITVSNINSPVINVLSAISPLCHGYCNGSISVSVSGGISPYTFLWSPGGQTTTTISALCAGTYIFQVTDAASCISFETIILTEPTAISVGSPVITNVTCNGGNNGSICLSPTGGVSPYTFLWSNGQTTSCATGLTAGTYTVTIGDAVGCSDVMVIPISEPTLLSVIPSSSNVICNGNCDGTASVVVSGGTFPYTYSWNTGSPLPSIVGQCPGTYSVLVTDNHGCSNINNFVITEPSVLTSTVTSSNITCNGNCDGTASVVASGGTFPYTYLWSLNGQTTSSITGLCAGTYIIAITDAHSCATSQSVTITQPLLLTATVTTTNATCFGTCNGTASVSAAGGSPPYTYLWSGGQTTSSVTGLCAGSYTLTVSDANSCNSVQIFSITYPAQLQANINSTSPSCSGSCDGTVTSYPIGGTAPYTFLWNNSQTTATATGLCAGTVTLTLTDANNCFISQFVTLFAPAPVTLSSAATQATCGVCNGSITDIPSGGTAPYTYLWNTGATTATITGLCANIYTLTVTDANGCTNTDAIILNNTAGPILTLSETNVTCFGACNGTASVIATGDSPFIYLWTPGGQTTTVATGLCPANYFINVTDINGCITINNINLTQPPQMAASSNITKATCFGLCDGAITVTASGGTGAYTYLWLPGRQTTSSISSQCAGNYSLTITDANNCILTNTLTIGQNTIITSSVTSTNNFCNASCIGTATVTISGGTLPYTYLWSNSQTNSIATGLCAGTHTITVTDAIGCIKIDSAIITEPTALTTTVSGVNPLCNGDCNGSVSVTTTGGTPPYIYSWNNGCTTTACTGLCAGTYTIIVTDNNGCIIQNTISITAPTVLSVTNVITNTSCNYSSDGSINITPTGGIPSYTFSWSNGATTEDITTLTAGLYSVTITDTNGCSINDTIRVGVTTVVTAIAGKDTSFCTGGTATLCNNSINATSIGWYQLTNWTSLGNTNCINVSPDVGSFSYALIAQNGICMDTDTVVVTVVAYPVVIASNDITICSGSTVSICASGAGNYQWYQLPTWTSLGTGACVNVSPVIGITNYAVIGLNSTCADTDTVSITVLHIPIANAGNDITSCSGNSITFCGTAVNATSYSWYEITSWTLIDTTACITTAPFSSTDYVFVATNGFCSDTDTVATIVYSLPLVDAGNDVTILSSKSTVLNGTGSGIYTWMPSAGLNDTTIYNPIATPSVTTTYTLMVTDVNGCTNMDSVTVIVVPDVIATDGISPNGDGKNDEWIIPNIEKFPGCVVEIYNRWGELLFRSVGYTEKFKGTYKGKNLPVGTYYYVINLNSKLHEEPITGPITIMR